MGQHQEAGGEERGQLIPLPERALSLPLVPGPLRLVVIVGVTVFSLASGALSVVGISALIGSLVASLEVHWGTPPPHVLAGIAGLSTFLLLGIFFLNLIVELNRDVLSYFRVYIRTGKWSSK